MVWVGQPEDDEDAWIKRIPIEEGATDQCDQATNQFGPWYWAKILKIFDHKQSQKSQVQKKDAGAH